MKIPKPSPKWIALIVGVIVVAVVWWQHDRWMPHAKQWLANQLADELNAVQQEAVQQDPKEGGDDHAHAGHVEATSLELSDQARRNIGLSDDKIQQIELQTFSRMLNVPARVVEKPGRTHIQVAAPMTGVVTAVYTLQGEAVQPRTLLFKIRLTHEDLVQAQTTFLQTLGELDVEEREIARLKPLVERGVIATKTLLQRQYAKDKLLAVLSAHREALLLHGLTTKQIDSILSKRRLVREVEIAVPQFGQIGPESKRTTIAIEPTSAVSASIQPVAADSDSDRSPEQGTPARLLVVQHVKAQTGQFVKAGDTLCTLADLAELYIEGRAFEQDTTEITRAARMQAAGINGWGVTAVPESKGKQLDPIVNLKIVYVANQVESDSRALHFYVSLSNTVLHDMTTPGGHRFLTWRFKPGQRMQLRVPVEQWKDRIVLPVDAVAQEGAETFVFQQNGNHFDRQAVHVEYQDQFWAVIANDGSLYPGDTVAFTGAHQMQVALKNQAGGGVDPHAGHNH
jgi:biotin carboxyl carrier protein